jgi:hypothetical protein
MRTMVELMRGGRPAADVMELLAADERPFLDRLARAGRNDPCPCESGLKVKRCHGRPEISSVLPDRTGTPRPPVTERGRRAAERSKGRLPGPADT